MEVKTILNEAEVGMKRALDHAHIDLSKIRTGRASVSMLDSVNVDYYGAMTPLSQVANISTPDATAIVVQPWEKTMLGPIEKAILAANLGMTPNNDGQIIRLSIPALTEERRREIAKQAKQIAEDSKVGVRNARRDAIDHLKKAEKEDHLSEDLRRDGEGSVQALTDKYIAEIDKVFAAKEKEILTV
ncbi:MAG: ribosome recycling factor [Ignavibacteriae bacterium]|nr:ribosome recycling factor [Ignavibacteriota bacterium]MCB9217304.1 ribosome recycling factor [Ignavibacteria bacterium]